MIGGWCDMFEQVLCLCLQRDLQLYVGHNHHNGPKLPPLLNESTAMYLQGYRLRLLFAILQDISVFHSNFWWGSWFYSSLPDHLVPCCCFSISFRFLSESSENAVPCPSLPPFWYNSSFSQKRSWSPSYSPRYDSWLDSREYQSKYLFVCDKKMKTAYSDRHGWVLLVPFQFFKMMVISGQVVFLCDSLWGITQQPVQ